MDWSYLLAIALAPFAVKAIEKWDERDRKRRAEAGLPPEGYTLGFRAGRAVKRLAAFSKAAHNFLIGGNFLGRRNSSARDINSRASGDEGRGEPR